jgi:pimeloyl-ACP methyl ester carboxylesterase
VVVAGPHPDVLLRQALAHPTQALRSSYAGFFQLPWLPEAVLGAFDFATLRRTMRRSAPPGTFEAGALDRYADAWRRPRRLTTMLNWYRALRLRRGGEPARLTPPVLILWGGRDRFLETHLAEAGLALCDDGRLVVVDDASHWLHLEAPARVVDEIIAFVRPATDGTAAAMR